MPNKQYNAVFKHFRQNIRAYPKVKQNLDWQWLGKCCILGQIWAKRDKSLVCPKYRDLGGVEIPGKCRNFSPLLNLEKLFPALKLTRNCYLKWTYFFMKTDNLIINWVSLPSSNILCLLTKYEISGASNSLVNQKKYGGVT